MNTELSPEITRTYSKGHGKIANNNSFTDLAEIKSGCNVQSYQTTCYRNLTWQTKAWHESTKYIEQNSLTDQEPKRIRGYDGIHVNMANYMTDTYMAETTISRHVGELVPLTKEKNMAWQGNQQ